MSTLEWETETEKTGYPVINSGRLCDTTIETAKPSTKRDLSRGATGLTMTGWFFTTRLNMITTLYPCSYRVPCEAINSSCLYSKMSFILDIMIWNTLLSSIVSPFSLQALTIFWLIDTSWSVVSVISITQHKR